VRPSNSTNDGSAVFCGATTLGTALLSACVLIASTGCGSDPITIESSSPRTDPAVSRALASEVAAPGARSDPIPSRSSSGLSGPASGRDVVDTAAPLAAEPWEFAGQPGRVHVSEHFRIHSTLQENSLDRALSTFSERALTHYRSALVDLPAPKEPLQTYIFGSRNQWERYTRERLGGNAGPYLAMGKGGYTTQSDAVLYDIGRLDTLTILAHEGWHQYTQKTFKHTLPVWLEEGIACWMEAVRPGRGETSTSPFLPWRNFERFGELRNGTRSDTLIPLEALLDSTPEQFLRQGKDRLLLYYAQTWALVHFLNEGEDGRYREALQQLVSDAAAGRLAGRMSNSQTFPNPRARGLHLHSRVGKWVLLEYFNPRFAEFKSQYERFLREVTAGSASQRVWRGESPLPPRSES